MCLTDTLKDLSCDLHWCSCNIFSAQDHSVATIMHDKYDAVFYCKGNIIEEYWDCIINYLNWLEVYGKGCRSDLIYDDGGDMNLLIHEGKKAEG